jgi:hypothetical protein
MDSVPDPDGLIFDKYLLFPSPNVNVSVASTNAVALKISVVKVGGSVLAIL